MIDYEKRKYNYLEFRLALYFGLVSGMVIGILIMILYAGLGII